MIRLAIFLAAAPLLPETIEYDLDTPTCFFLDPLENTQHLVLLSPICEAFSRNGERPNGHARYTPDTVLDLLVIEDRDTNLSLT